MAFSATPTTAALAGVFSAVAWPVLSPHLHDSDPTGTVWFGVATLLVFALPAHALVLGFNQNQTAGARTVDTALLKRIGTWLLAAGATLALSALYRSS